MAQFIRDVLKDLTSKSVNISQVTFILPNKRAGLFLKNELSNLVKKSLFAPEILSIEEFVEQLSELRQLTDLELLFEFYSIYLKHTKEEQHESFDSFSSWALIALQDFNEIDRYLVDPERLFNYLNAIKDLEHWSVDSNQTSLIKSHLSFWKNLSIYYSDLVLELKSKGVAYQGLIYREAVDNLHLFMQSNPLKKIVFLGFNALNKSESLIIQELLQSSMAEIYWDIDTHFLTNQKHSAGHFIRMHKATWKYYDSNVFNWSTEFYSTDKNITVVGTPKHIGQAKYIGELLFKLNSTNFSFDKTAVILGNENLLAPVINSIPAEIKKLNITMGFPLRYIPLTSLFKQLFVLHKNNASSYYYKDVIGVLSHQFINPIFQIENNGPVSSLILNIQANNLVFLSKKKLHKLVGKESKIIELLFEPWRDDPKIALQRCSDIIFFIKDHFDKNAPNSPLVLEYLFRINEVINTITELNTKYNYLNSVKTLEGLFDEIVRNETLDFQGEPLQGLQIMGMLESRVLDFETVIIAGVNEGLLPAGKSNNSFIPFDLKLENKLPTYKEKDAVYTYHFYRLLQRAKNVYLIYNTEPDVLEGGEKSRFISQLEIEGIHDLKQIIISPSIPKAKRELKRIKKTEAVIKAIEDLAKNGFSPSSLTNYIRNPLDFYYQKILRIEESDDVEETVAAKTLGTVIHETLKELYQPYLNQSLSEDHIREMTHQVETLVLKYFRKEFKQGNLDKGKNLIVFEIANRYIQNFLDLELDLLKKGNTIKVLEVEIDVDTTITIKELPFPIVLKGQIDRIDEFNGSLRIIDYKTGKVDQPQVEIIDWEDITTDYDKYSKSFQLLTYALILNDKNLFKKPVEAGIISFKNLNKGLLKFARKDSQRSRNKDTAITQEVLQDFSMQLKHLILEICNSNIDFVEKEV